MTFILECGGENSYNTNLSQPTRQRQEIWVYSFIGVKQIDALTSRKAMCATRLSPPTFLQKCNIEINVLFDHPLEWLNMLVFDVDSVHRRNHPIKLPNYASEYKPLRSGSTSNGHCNQTVRVRSFENVAGNVRAHKPAGEKLSTTETPHPALFPDGGSICTAQRRDLSERYGERRCRDPSQDQTL